MVVTVYASQLDANFTLDTLGEFAGGVTPQTEVNSKTVVGTADLDNIQDAFRFYTTSNVLDGITAGSINGLPKKLTSFAEPIDNIGEDEMTELLSREIFGSSASVELFNNLNELKESFKDASSNCLGSVNAIRRDDGAASAEVINSILYQDKQRFTLEYKTVIRDNSTNNIVEGTMGTYENVTIGVKTTDADNNVTYPESGAVCTIMINSAKKVDNITITQEPSNPIPIGSHIRMICGDQFIEIESINSVQAALINGTLTNDTGTPAPFETGDIVRVKFTINSHTGQTGTSNDVIAVSYTSYRDYGTPVVYNT